ncbi:MAG: hypothetical protein LW878_03730 [Proteobacteria bacterium]|nr:hypothetical protein [Pseudomonadota bacterium]
MKTLLISLLLLSLRAHAEIFVGTGLSTTTQGRSVPILYLGADTPQYAAIFSSVGVKNDVYYHSAYQVSYFKQTDLDQFWWGKIRAGFGGGLHYAKRGLQDGTTEEEASDFSLGPSVRVSWQVAPWTVIGIESFTGIGSVNIILLSSQQITTMFLGVRF